MRLVEFLICLLQAHAQTLQRLAALHGEDVLFEMLEASGEAHESEPHPKVNPIWFGRPHSTGHHTMASAYAELEHAVHEVGLSPTLEFHLWAYPHYRAFIESPVDLNSVISGHGSETVMTLVDEAVAQAAHWIKKLPVSPEMSQQTESAAQIPWLRFRSGILKKIGKRPMGSI